MPRPASAASPRLRSRALARRHFHAAYRGAVACTAAILTMRRAAVLQAAAAWQEVEQQGQAQRQAQAQGARPVRDFAAEAAAAEEEAATRRLRAAAAAHEASKEWRRFCAEPSDEEP